MNADASLHPSADDLALFARGALDPARQSELERHVESCDACCDALRAVPDDTLVGALRTHAAGASRAVRSAPEEPERRTIPEALRDHPRFRIVKPLGAGGMGVVYKAEHRFMERPVALKVIHRRLLGNATALERFRLEVKAAARLAHPNIVTAYDADQAGDLQLLVMEYVDGVSLARQVEKGGPLSVRHACQIARQVALGLQHAHEKGMVHRDVKPQNLMLTRDGRVKILDFGLARFAKASGVGDSPSERSESRESGDTAPDSAGLTRIGSALGTPDYMAPEQIRNARDVDIRADIYALGGTLYWMLAGHSPFPEGSVADKLESQLGRAPLDLSFVRSDVPEPLRRVIERMLAKNPDDRYPTPADVARALAPFCQAPDERGRREVEGTPRLRAIADRAVATARRHLRGIAWASLALLTLAVVVLGLARPPGGASPSTDESAAAARTESGRVRTSERGAGAPAVPAASRPRMLVVIPREDFSYVEFEMVRKACVHFGADVETASSTCEPVRPARGASVATVAVDVALEDADPARYDGVVFLGAATPSRFDHLQDAGFGAVVRAFVQRLALRNRPIASLGGGTRVLADLDLLRGKHAARFAGLPADPSYGERARWLAQGVVSDSPFLTAADRSSIKELVRELVTPRRDL